VRVLYPGGFDLLHRGHLNALRAAREIADPGCCLIVAINSDEFMAAYKRVPIRSEQQRMEDIRRTGLADDVILWNGPEGQDAQILAQEPQVYVASSDWLERDLAHQLRLPSLQWFDDHSIGLFYVHRTPGISTTLLLEEGQS